MRTGWTRYRRYTGSLHSVTDDPRVILSVQGEPRYDRYPTGYRWNVERLTKVDRASGPPGHVLVLEATGVEPTISIARGVALRTYAELARRAKDGATRPPPRVVDSQMTDREPRPQTHRATERTETGGA